MSVEARRRGDEMIRPQNRDAFRALLAESAVERARVRRLVERGRRRDAEDDDARRARFEARRRRLNSSAGRESLRGPSIDLQTVSFLTEGSQIRRAVALVEVNDARGAEIGSGFLVSRRLFMTNQHVIPDAAAALATTITFDRENDEHRRPRQTTVFRLDPDAFALFSDESEYDYALIAVGERLSGAATLDELGFCVLSDRGDKHAKGMNTNIIQHPNGWPKMISVRSNLLVDRTDRALLYETDTEVGSSGSPVFNDDWDLVALHHYGEPYTSLADAGEGVPRNANEGIRISRICSDLEARASDLAEPQRRLLKEALSLAEEPPPQQGMKRLSEPRTAHSTPSSGRPESKERPGSGSGRAPVAPRSLGGEYTSSEHSMNEQGDTRVSFVIPLEVSMRLRAPTVAAGASDPAGSLERSPAAGAGQELQLKQLRRGPEALRIDPDYSSRDGYAADFLPGIDLPLPEIMAPLAAQVAPLRAGEPEAKRGVLKYTHFSVVLNRATRVAIYTATNIDGDTWLSVDRATGKVNASEGETWFKDPRVSGSFVLDQSFYSEWSTYFDRGHLTRRNDPTWGTPEDASRANADTFHFTNCSPQHFRFNQSSKFWQGVERHVLENGVLASSRGEHRRLCVLQGPIYNDTIDLWADDVQIPSSFWKVVAWKAASGLKAVGLVVDQLALLSESRVSLGAPRDVVADVSQWRDSIADIGRRAGLQFPAALIEADTFGTGDAGRVGSEAARPIRAWSDLKLV